MVIMAGSENYTIGEKYIYAGEIVTAIKHAPCIHIEHSNGCSGCMGRLTYIKDDIIHSTCGHTNMDGTLKLVFKVAFKTNNRW
jgi:hypothetical protein